MKYKVLFLAACLTVLSSLASAQQPATTAQTDISRYAKEKLCEIREDELKKCQQKIKEWDDWAAINKPKNDALAKENERLERENRELKDPERRPALAEFVAVGTGVGVGVGIIVLLVLFWRKLTPTTPRKQLAILILCSMWIITAGLLLASDSNLSKHPINLIVSVFIYSLPAILFGGIALWWLKRTKPDVIKVW